MLPLEPQSLSYEWGDIRSISIPKARLKSLDQSWPSYFRPELNSLNRMIQIMQKTDVRPMLDSFMAVAQCFNFNQLQRDPNPWSRSMIKTILRRGIRTGASRQTCSPTRSSKPRTDFSRARIFPAKATRFRPLPTTGSEVNNCEK